MHDVIQAFFEELRDPVICTDAMRAAVSEVRWRLAMRGVDEMEAKIGELYDAGAVVPSAIILIDAFIAIVSRQGTAPWIRFREVAQLMRFARQAALQAGSGRNQIH
jgi:hypothetical protein